MTNKFEVIYGTHEFKNVHMAYFATTTKTLLQVDKPDEVMENVYTVIIISDTNKFELPEKWNFNTGVMLTIAQNDVIVCQGLFRPVWGQIDNHSIHFTIDKKPTVWRI